MKKNFLWSCLCLVKSHSSSRSYKVKRICELITIVRHAGICGIWGCLFRSYFCEQYERLGIQGKTVLARHGDQYLKASFGFNILEIFYLMSTLCTPIHA